MSAVKVSTLIGPALDWAVAKALDLPVVMLHDLMWKVAAENNYKGDLAWHFEARKNEPWIATGHGIEGSPLPEYGVDWSYGGPIIERWKINIGVPELWKETGVELASFWDAQVADASLDYIHQSGPTPLIAAMRCYVASKLGDEVDIPEELK